MTTKTTNKSLNKGITSSLGLLKPIPSLLLVVPFLFDF